MNKNLALLIQTPYARLAGAIALVLVSTGFLAPDASAETRCQSKLSQETIATLAEQAPRLDREVLQMGISAAFCAVEQRKVERDDLVTIIDYSVPSTEPRLWVFDLRKQRLLFEEHVAHGVNSGHDRTTSFSNVEGSRQSSLGLYVTDNPYVGRNGYSLRLRGLDHGFNDRAWKRAIVMHGADYVNPTVARAQGRLGRSWGCPAVRTAVAREMIDTIKGGTPIFAYYPDQDWLATSAFLSSEAGSLVRGSIASR
ncbi:MAG: murein L,D-transpeptidase catalytic domain family protein [Thermoanaerobaculia bacterium]|nr:murein L,D-transpeptidase catalytic domain family protein [Thermoanaerobaculia bacterium]